MIQTLFYTHMATALTAPSGSRGNGNALSVVLDIYRNEATANYVDGNFNGYDVEPNEDSNKQPNSETTLTIINAKDAIQNGALGTLSMA